MVSYVKDQVKETFYLTNCDILTLEDYDEIYEYHKNAGNVITMIVSLKSVHVPYGVVHTDENQNLVGSTEKPTYMILVNTGVYIVEPDVFNYIGCEEKVDFPTVINRIKNDGKKVGIYPITTYEELMKETCYQLYKVVNNVIIFYPVKNEFIQDKKIYKK